LLLGAVVEFVKFGVYASGLRAPAGQTLADTFGFDTIAKASAAALHGGVGGAGLRTVAILAAIFIFAAVVRAAQFPFHVWLGDAALFTPLFVLASGNLVRVYRTRDIHEMGGAWRRMRGTTVALVTWALGVGGLSLSSYYALSATFADVSPRGTRVNGAARVMVAALVVVASLLTAVYALRVVGNVCA